MGFDIRGNGNDAGLCGRFVCEDIRDDTNPVYVRADGDARLYVDGSCHSWTLFNLKVPLYFAIPASDPASGCVPVGDAPIVCQSYDRETGKPSTPPTATLTIKRVDKAEVEAEKQKFDQDRRDEKA